MFHRMRGRSWAWIAGACAGLIALLGLRFPLHSLAFALGLVGGAAVMSRLLAHRRPTEPSTSARRVNKEIQRPREGSAYDLERDTSTDSQRWLM